MKLKLIAISFFLILVSSKAYGATNQLPLATGDTTDGVTISASTVSGTDYAWKAADRNVTTMWSSGSGGPHTWKVDFGAGNEKTITSYSVLGAGNYPRRWTFYGSNDDSAWTSLDARESADENTSSKRTYTFTNLTAYRYYKFVISAQAGGSSVKVYEYELIGEPGDTPSTPSGVVYQRPGVSESSRFIMV